MSTRNSYQLPYHLKKEFLSHHNITSFHYIRLGDGKIRKNNNRHISKRSKLLKDISFAYFCQIALKTCIYKFLTHLQIRS